MGYGASKGRRPIERASKISHTEVIRSPLVQDVLATWDVPSSPPEPELRDLLVELPKESGRIKAVIAIDGGFQEIVIREDFPSATVAFLTLGPLYLRLDDLRELDEQPFLGPDDMAKLRNLERYSLVVPTRLVRARGVGSFSAGVRKSIHDFLSHKDGHLLKALSWLLFREWRPSAQREEWNVPRCPNPDCSNEGKFTFRSGSPSTQECPSCHGAVYLADALRLYERTDDDHGASGILSYLLTTLEQIVLVHLIKSILDLKESLLPEVLFIKDGPLAFFGTTAPLCRPMQELMAYLGAKSGGAQLNLVGVEKSGPFVEHAARIEKAFGAYQALPLSNRYIYRYIVPGDAASQEFGRNTYYGSKVILRGGADDMYVATVPTNEYKATPSLSDFLNAGDVLRVTSRLRCSMYDNALVPVALANKLVSLADVPSSEILAKFARDRLRASGSLGS